MYLNDEQIIEIMSNYITDERYQQAILLDGEWGCGKTYFVKKKLIKELESINPKKDVLYISLYGIKSVEQIEDKINSKIFENILINKIKVNKKHVKKVAKGIKILSGFKKGLVKKYIDIDDNTFSKIDELANDLENANENIIIFDDLERCDMDINNLLGYINHLVEHDNVKVIIVANQSEIGSLNANEDLPNKYSVVLNERLNLSKEEIDTLTKKNKQDDLINKSELEKLTNELFSDNSQYERIKEKLIGLTIYYHNDLEKIYDSLIEDNVKNTCAKDYLKDKKKEVLKIFEENKHQNIRTLIFGLIAFDTIYQIINMIQFSPEKYLEKQKIDILKYLFESSIRIKTGKFEYMWDKGTSKYRMIYWEDKTYSMFGKCIQGYQFIDDYLLYQKYDKNEIVDEISSIMSAQKVYDTEMESDRQLSINNLHEWWKMEDNEVNTLLSNIKKELLEHKYCINQFRDIITSLMVIEDYDFNVNVQDYINIMIKEINNCDIDNYKKEYLEIGTSDQCFLSKYNEFIKPILEIIDKKNKEVSNHISDFIINNKPWNKEFVDKCVKNKDYYQSECRFLGFVDSQELISKISSSKTKDIYYFIDGIKEIYSFSNLNDFYKADEKNIEEILKELDSCELNDSKTKKVAIKNLKQVLEDALSKIKR